MNDPTFDFGFTTLSEDELEISKDTDAKINDLESRLDQLYNSIIPLINNLQKNPEKDYIFWPNRQDKIAEYKDKIFNIWKGKHIV